MAESTKDSVLFQREGKPPAGELLPLALQHVVAAVVGIITPAIIVANTCGLTADEKTMLIQVSLVMAGLITLVQAHPLFNGKIGSGLPIIMGASFAYVPTLTSIGGSFGIGAFFAMPFMMPAQIAAMEIKVTGKDHTAMYFAIQSLIASIMAAISTGLVYEQLKNIVSPKIIDGVEVVGETWKIGGSLVPVIVSLTCVFGIIMAGKLPKHYTEEIVSEEMQAIENRRKK